MHSHHIHHMFTLPENKYKKRKIFLIAASVVEPFIATLLIIYFEVIGPFIFLTFILELLTFVMLVRNEFKIYDEESVLQKLKIDQMHQNANVVAQEQGCSVTTIYAARILAKLGQDRISPKFTEGANKVRKLIDYYWAMKWMKEEASYTQRFALVAFAFKLVDDGYAPFTGLSFITDLDLNDEDYKKFQAKYNTFQELYAQRQAREAQLIQQCDMAMGQLVGLMLRLNKTNYQQKAYRSIKTLIKIGGAKHGQTFYQKTLENDSLSIDEAIESVSLALIEKKAKIFVKLMFDLAVEDDGIKNDEWRLLQLLLARMEFDEKVVAGFVEHYQSLRTDFDTDGFQKVVDKTKLLAEYRELLGVDEDATVKQIQEAYHRLALINHPDLPKNAGRKKECEQLMSKINNAYTQLVIKKKE